jgi:hypothetical protein
MTEIENNSNQKTFNPNDHLVQLKSKQGSQDYLPVQFRLVWFRLECPHGTIETEEMEVDLDRVIESEGFVWNAEKRRSEKVTKSARGYARFRATVTDGKGGKATGTGSECAADFGDYIEKAETKAIGRALAALGYGTQFAPELAESHRIVDAPVESRQDDNNGRSSNRPTEPAPDAPATEQQWHAIRQLCSKLERAEPEPEEITTYLDAKQEIQRLSKAYKENQKA